MSVASEIINETQSETKPGFLARRRQNDQQPDPSLAFVPSPAFAAASFAALAVGVLTFLIGLWNHDMGLAEKGFYATLLPFGLFGVISLQKSVRDKAEGTPTTSFYLILSGVAVGISALLMAVGLFNATWPLPDKGFFGMSFVLAMFAAVVIQKNVRDQELAKQL